MEATIPPTAHEQVAVKVNAYCDRSIAPVVEALSEIEGLRTFESCESGYAGRAVVYFHFGWGVHELTDLLKAIAAYLGNSDPYVDYELAMVWFGSMEQPHARLVFDKEHAAVLATSIRRFRYLRGSSVGSSIAVTSEAKHLTVA
jgi:hypothetical protein